MSKMNLWTRYRLNCPSKQLFSFHDLNMKRKALTLQHKQNAYNVTKKQKFSLIVKDRYYTSRTPAASEPRECFIGINDKDGSPASTNDVPGDKSFIIYNDLNIPIYNYIPVKRIYRGGANKYPYTAWSYGKAGFGVGLKGSSRESRAAAARELAANPNRYNRKAIKICSKSLSL